MLTTCHSLKSFLTFKELLLTIDMKEFFLTAPFYFSFDFLNVIQEYSNVNTNSNIGEQVKFIYKDLNHQSNYYNSVLVHTLIG